MPMLVGVCYFSCRRYYTFQAMPEPKQKQRSRERSRGRSRTCRRSSSSSESVVVVDEKEETESRPPPPDPRVDGQGRSKSKSPARKRSEEPLQEPSTTSNLVCEICNSEVKGSPVGLKMHQESSKHCLSYLYWHKGYKWNEAKKKADAKWKAWNKNYYRRKELDELKGGVRVKSPPRHKKSPSLRRKSPRRGEKDSARAKSPGRPTEKINSSRKNDEKAKQPAKHTAKSKDQKLANQKKESQGSPSYTYEYSDSAEDNDPPKSSGSQAAKQAQPASKNPVLALAGFYESQARFMRSLT